MGGYDRLDLLFDHGLLFIITDVRIKKPAETISKRIDPRGTQWSRKEGDPMRRLACNSSITNTAREMVVITRKPTMSRRSDRVMAESPTWILSVIQISDGYYQTITVKHEPSSLTTTYPRGCTAPNAELQAHIRRDSPRFSLEPQTCFFFRLHLKVESPITETTKNHRRSQCLICEPQPSSIHNKHSLHVLSRCARPFGPCYIINVQGGLAMDLDLSDPKGDHYGNGYKVWSRRLHGRENQQWLFNHKKTGGWTVKNVASHTYLGFATKQQPEHTKQLVCSVERPEYNITGNKWDGYVIRARSPDPKIVIDLANGDVKDGTTILFWFENGGQNQKWLIMPLLYREQLFKYVRRFLRIPMGIIMRILNVKTGLMFDGGDPNDWLYGWTWRGHTQRHDDNWLKLSVDDGTEFLFDGDEDHGFFSRVAQPKMEHGFKSPAHAETGGTFGIHMMAKETIVYRALSLTCCAIESPDLAEAASATARLVASYSSTERHPPCFDGHRLLALVLPVTCLQALLQPKTARRPSRLVVSPQGMWWLIPTHEDEQPCLPARISHTASQPFRYYIAWFVAALHNVSNMIVSMPGIEFSEMSKELMVLTNREYRIFSTVICLWYSHVGRPFRDYRARE
ncbi:hypothetical protein AG1IA_03750 [Rhizoctonia solani AG-1 IA]|uniref:Ricin B lectin domain-containing protein n=1 Tax=Thanatephorus cucumeris (strain AG1-IA) TaxID=983506 RepID=L8X0S4_THACA|nr:hypothetical protein AG1IA_03750 [Rhizoctonia solani AG-1 IA]